MAACTICSVRKAKRYCTARGEDICTQCCATEREVTVNCPFECDYLRESRRHDKRVLDPEQMPYREVHLDQEFLQRAELVLMLMAAFLNKALEPVPNATDRDVYQVLDALVASFRSEGEAKVDGEVAAGILERVQEKLAGLISELKERESGPFTDQAFLGVAVFMARVAHGHDNGRPHCRAYVHYLREAFPV